MHNWCLFFFLFQSTIIHAKHLLHQKYEELEAKFSDGSVSLMSYFHVFLINSTFKDMLICGRIRIALHPWFISMLFLINSLTGLIGPDRPNYIGWACQIHLAHYLVWEDLQFSFSFVSNGKLALDNNKGPKGTSIDRNIHKTSSTTALDLEPKSGA